MMTWDDFCKKAKKTVAKTADKINQTADLATLQVKLTMSEHKLDEAYTELGRVAYQHFSSPDSNAEAVAAAITAVDQAQAVIDAYKAEIAALKP